jgi:hypothetical protein
VILTNNLGLWTSYLCLQSNWDHRHSLPCSAYFWDSLTNFCLSWPWTVILLNSWDYRPIPPCWLICSFLPSDPAIHPSFTYPFIRPFTPPSTHHPSIYPFHPPTPPFTHLSIPPIQPLPTHHPSIYPFYSPIHPSTHLPTHPTIHLFHPYLHSTCLPFFIFLGRYRRNENE